MMAVIDWGSSLVASLLKLAILVMWFGAAAWCGVKVSEYFDRDWLGWVVGIIVASLLFLVLNPIIDALTALECKTSSDFEACVNGHLDDTEPFIVV